MSIERHGAGPRMTQAVIHGDTVYLSGQIADDFGAPVDTQTRQVLAKIDQLLAQSGSSKSKLLSAEIWLTDMRDFDSMNGVWDGWVDPQATPARATCQALLAHPDIRVEITVVAAR